MDYLKAIAAAFEAAGLAADGIKYLVNHSEDITKSLKSLSKMLDAAKGLMDKAGDVVPIDELITKAEADDLEAWEDVEPVYVVPPTNKPQLKTPEFLKKARDRVAVFADEQKTSFERRKLEQEMWKAVHDSRRKVLEGATIKLSMKELVEKLDSEKKDNVMASLGVLDLPGCFAIARYGKIELGKDPTSYNGIYVGKDVCVGEGIARTIAPTGNADVVRGHQVQAERVGLRLHVPSRQD